MEAWIQDISTRSCYTRLGKVIPKKETKIDVEKYFGKDVLNLLKSDPLIKVVVHNAKDLQKEKIEAVKKEEVVKQVEKKEEVRLSNVTKTVARKRAR